MALLTIVARGAGLAIGATVILASCKRLASGVNRAQTQAAQVTRGLTVDPESALSDAGNERFRARRDAVARLRAALRTWAVAESTFLADSGHPGFVVLPYDAMLAKGSQPATFMGPWYHGPGAWVSVQWGEIVCWVYVGADTTVTQRASGQPDCAARRALPHQLAEVLGLEPPPAPPPSPVAAPDSRGDSAPAHPAPAPSREHPPPPPAPPAPPQERPPSPPQEPPVVRCEQVGPSFERHGPSAVLAAGREGGGGSLFIWGGLRLPDTTAAKLLVFRPTAGALDTADVVGSPPAGVFIPAMATDERRSTIYVFGGWARDARHPTDEFFRIDLTHHPYRWEQVARTDPWPPARNGASLVYDSAGDALVLFGGDGGPGPGADVSGFRPLGDLWRYDLRAQRWRLVPGQGVTPSPRWEHMMAVDPATDRAYLVGGDGLGAGRLDSSLYELDLHSLAWQPVVTRGQLPPPLQGGTLTFDRGEGALVLAGGLRHHVPGDATISEVWVFYLASSTWLGADCGNVLRRRDDAGAYDPETRAHYLFGGIVSPAVGRWGQFGPRVGTIVRLKVTPRP